MSKYTPGPWTVNELNAQGFKSKHYIFIEPNIAVIEKKISGHDQNDWADACLIAAAPDLLAALVDCREALVRAGATGELRVVDAAIAKATGETK
jgi:hypothetical protein